MSMSMSLDFNYQLKLRLVLELLRGEHFAGGIWDMDILCTYNLPQDVEAHKYIHR
jgi:hypothetical protein